MSGITPRTTTVTLYQGDDQAVLDILRAKVEKSRRSKAELLSDDDPLADFEAALAKADDRAVVLGLRAQPRRKWRELVAEHPPRTGNEGDEETGVNVETFSDALILKSVADYDGDLEDLLESLSDAQFSKVYGEAFALNRSLGRDPKDFLASAKTRTNGETSK